MELIVKLGRKLSKSGKYLESCGLFLCLFCLQEVIRRLGAGKIAKSCGCIHGQLISETKKGKKLKPFTEEHKQNIGKAHKGKKRDFTEEHRKNIGEGNKGKKRTIEQKQNISNGTKGKSKNKLENNPNWNNGSSFEPYSPEFNSALKQQILERDNYTCQNPNCEHKSTKLDIHHINYDKKNNSLDNLIILCNSCHAKSNFNRCFWINYYQQMIGDINVRRNLKRAL